VSRSNPMDVTLVSMPFAEVQRPSIALGLLQAALTGTEIRSEVVYANLRFAEYAGLVSYQAVLSTPTDHLLGEWCFAGILFPDFHPDDDAYLELVLDVRANGFAAGLEQRKSMMRALRALTAEYVDEVARSILERGPRIVGCSSMFQQHCASLALLKRVRELSPETVTLIGGANCEGEMGVETLRAFPWIDCVVSGEADALFGDLCRVLLEHGAAVDAAAVPNGALTRAHLPLESAPGSQSGASAPRSIVRDLDRLPTPNYDHYFAALRTSTLSNMIRPGLLAESSRGCWWGEKSHCTFCGLNGIGMSYRSKSARRVLEELDELSERYGLRNIQFVDNILDMAHIQTVLAPLAAGARRYSLFYETKANLKREQVELLADAGVKWIQPGIESMDDRVLALIGKGNSALMNVQLLKWASEYGIHTSWNFLCGFPGESDSWYAEMAHWLPAILHLQPPSGVIRVRYDRFSPYQMRPEHYGIALTPSRTYAYVYPLSADALMRLAYSFEDRNRPGRFHRGIHDQPGHRALHDVVQQWNDAWRLSPPVLQVDDGGEQLHITDTRPCARARQRTIADLEAAVYRACDRAQTPQSLLRHASAQRGADVSWQEIEPAVETLCAAGLLLRLNGRLLSLGVFRNRQTQARAAATDELTSLIA